jgi:serine/threonine-protein phosphatase 6 regulatory subunit 3
MCELVQYITEMPSDDSNSKRAFRYPFYACELLCCEVPKVTEAFFGEDKYKNL